MDEYTKNKELFLAQKQAEKDAYLNGVRDALERLPANPSEFSRYLTIQGRLPDYSVGNALSIVRYCPDARVVRLYANWEKLGYKPKVGMKGIPVLVPGTEYTRPDGTHGRHYDLRKAFDISHLQGSPALPLRPGNRVLLRGLMEYQAGGWEYTSVKDGPDALYDPSSNSISIREQQPIQYLFPALAREISAADLMMREGGTYEDVLPRAVCIAWMLCSHYELPPANLKLPQPEAVMGTDPRDYRRQLDRLRLPVMSMVNSVENVVRRQERAKEAETDPGPEREDKITEMELI